MSVFETQWKPEMTKDQAIAIAAEAIQAGIFNDLGSGSNVDVCIIEQNKPTQLLRNYIRPNERAKKERDYKFPRGTTSWLKEKIITKEEVGRYVTVQELSSDDDVVVVEKMDVDM